MGVVDFKSSLETAWMRVPGPEQKEICEGRKKGLTSGFGSATIKHCPMQADGFAPCKLNNEDKKAPEGRESFGSTGDGTEEGSHQFYMKLRNSFNKRGLCSANAV